MEFYRKNIEIRWSDLDPLQHVRHSAYYDWGAYIRMHILRELGLTPELFAKHAIGPIIFREECLFQREVRFQDSIIIEVALQKAKKDYSRWTMYHRVIKNDEVQAAIITVDGAWLDMKTRKLTIPPSDYSAGMKGFPLTDDYIWLD